MRELYYEEQLQKWAETKWYHSPIAVGWLDGKTNQRTRFKTLLDIGVSGGDSVLDVGCGVGHLTEYLNNADIKVHYTGIDTNKNAIDQAKKVYTNQIFLHSSVKDIHETYDWAVASGVFNREYPKVEMLETIRELISKVNKGVAFNLLKEFKKNSNLSYEFYHPVEIFSALNRHGALCTVVQNYGIENDFTIYIRKR